MNPPSVMLKVIVFAHFILSMWAMQSPYFLPVAYLYMNMFVLLFGIIAIFYNESSDAVLLFIVGLIISIVQDIVFLGIYEPIGQDNIKSGVRTSQRGEFRFSLGMCITNLLIKPITIFLLYKILLSRTTDYDNFIPGVPNIPGFSGARTAGAYENIDQPSPYRDPASVANDDEKSGPLP